MDASRRAGEERERSPSGDKNVLTRINWQLKNGEESGPGREERVAKRREEKAAKKRVPVGLDRSSNKLLKIWLKINERSAANGRQAKTKNVL